MNRHLILAIISIFTGTFSNAQIKLDSLNSIYLKNDSVQLLNFLNEWAKESQQLSKSFNVSNDTLKSVDEIFKKMYCPTKWRKIGHSEFGKSFYRNSKYIIVQTQINYSICHAYDYDFKMNDSCDHYKITNYYPNIKIKNKTILYLTPEYDSLINKFLGTEQIEVGVGGIMNTAKPTGESAKKSNFLNTYLTIIHGHWEGWEIISHPYISEIEFHKTYKKSNVNFTLIYEGGETKFKRIFGKWRKINSKMTWIT